MIENKLKKLQSTIVFRFMRPGSQGCIWNGYICLPPPLREFPLSPSPPPSLSPLPFSDSFFWGGGLLIIYFPQSSRYKQKKYTPVGSWHFLTSPYVLSGPQGRDFTSTTRAPPPFNTGYNPVYPGGAGYDPMYPGQRPPTGFNSIPHFNLTRQHTPQHIGKPCPP